MAKQIPILKLNNGTTNYYPFSVGESVVTTRDIRVNNDVGGYKCGEIIPAVTTLNDILRKMFTELNTGDITVEKPVKVPKTSCNVINIVDNITEAGEPFTENDSIVLDSEASIAEAVKLILMKLGMPERNITINMPRFMSVNND